METVSSLYILLSLLFGLMPINRITSEVLSPEARGERLFLSAVSWLLKFLVLTEIVVFRLHSIVLKILAIFSFLIGIFASKAFFKEKFIL